MSNNNIPGRGSYKPKPNPRYDTSPREYTEPKSQSEALEYLPIIGDSIDFAKLLEDLKNKDYTSAAVGAGLLFLPNWIEKPAKSAAKGIKNRLMKLDLKSLYKSQDASALEGIQEVFENYNGSKTLDNITPGGRYKVNPEVSERYIKELQTKPIGVVFNKDNYSQLGVLMKDRDGSYQTVKYSIQKGNDDMLSGLDKIMQKEGAKGGIYFNPISSIDNDAVIGIHRYDRSGKLRSNDEIKEIAAHEAGHLVQKYLNLNNPGLHSKINPAPLSRNWYWGKLTEVMSNVIAFRTMKKIGTRNLTDSEIIEFLNSEVGKSHFPDALKSKDILEQAKKVIRVLPSFVIGTPLYNYYNQKYGNSEDFKSEVR